MEYWDDDGYPTEEALDRIAKWNLKDQGILQLFEYVKDLWRYPTYWTETEVQDTRGPTKKFSISTGGWSGNEDLIQAMEENKVLMSFTWISSRRGGHHEFEVTKQLSDHYKGIYTLKV